MSWEQVSACVVTNLIDSLFFLMFLDHDFFKQKKKTGQMMINMAR
jgi:hypothetical protein